jgi:hypothetical protein
MLPHVSHMGRQLQAGPQPQQLLTIDIAAHILGVPSASTISYLNGEILSTPADERGYAN